MRYNDAKLDLLAAKVFHTILKMNNPKIDLAFVRNSWRGAPQWLSWQSR